MDSSDGAMRDLSSVGMRRAWVEQLASDRYGVFIGARRVGFIDVDGPLHVALRGDDYETAVEVDRAIRFDQALRALLAA